MLKFLRNCGSFYSKFELFLPKIRLNEIRPHPYRRSRAARQEGCGEECRAALRFLFLFSGAFPWNSDGADGCVGMGFRTVRVGVWYD
jgi:hypothetical protein